MPAATEMIETLGAIDAGGLKERLGGSKEALKESANSDEALNNFLNLKKEKLQKPYGIYDYEKLDPALVEEVRKQDAELGEMIDDLEKKEFAIKASVSATNPLFVKGMVERDFVLQEGTEIALAQETEKYTFAASINLEKLAEDLNNTEFRVGLVDRFGINLEQVPLEEQNAYILDKIRDDFRDQLGDLTKKHMGLSMSTSNSHVTGFVCNDTEALMADFQRYTAENFLKMYPEDNIDLETAGFDMTVVLAPHQNQLVTCAVLNQDAEGNMLVEALYKSKDGSIVAANNTTNALSLKAGLMEADPENGLSYMSPIMLVDRRADRAQEGYKVITNKKKGNSFAVKPLAFDHSGGKNIKVRTGEAAERYSPDLNVEQIRKLQKYRFASFIPPAALEKIALERYGAGGEINLSFEDVVNTQVKTEETDASLSMPDITGFSRMSSVLSECNVETSSIFLPMIKDLTKFAESMGALANEYAGDSARYMFLDKKDQQSLGRTQNERFNGLNQAEKSALMMVAADKIQKNFDIGMEQKVGAEYLSRIENMKPEDMPSLVAEINNEQDETLREAKAFLMGRQIIWATDGKAKYGMKTVSAVSKCDFKYKNVKQGSVQSGRETLLSPGFDKKRKVLEDMAREKSYVLDSVGFSKLSNPYIAGLFELQASSDEGGEPAYVLDIERANNNLEIQALVGF